jgi:hypothetical protein
MNFANEMRDALTQRFRERRLQIVALKERNSCIEINTR